MLQAALLVLPVGLVVDSPAAMLHGRDVPRASRCRVTPDIQMGLFDGLAKAFENDDSLGDRGDFKAKVSKLTWPDQSRKAWQPSLSSSRLLSRRASKGRSSKCSP